MGRQRLTNQFMLLIIGIGGLICLFSAHNLHLESIDIRFLILASLTVIISWRVAIQIPRVNTYVTVSDTLIFIAILLYGREASVLLAAGEGISSALRISKKPITILFSSAVMASSTFITVMIMGLAFGPISTIRDSRYPVVITALGVMALAQYISNTSIVAVGLACKTDSPIWSTWTKHYMWASITYFAGAVAAGLAVFYLDIERLYALLVIIPIIAVIYFTYKMFLEDIKATAARAEQAERRRAEQAERHVEELNRYIEEQKRISFELQESREHYRHAAFHDSLTGLPNRAFLIDQLRLAIELVEKQETGLFPLLFLDIDRFKNINDSLGHAVGDQLLVTISRRLEACIRPSDIVARLGGDEFAILIHGLKEDGEYIRIAERVQDELMQPFDLIGNEVYTTASIGITLSTVGYKDPDDILRDADTAMYHAKEKGKAQYAIFDTHMHAHVVALLQLENDLRRAIENRELRVYYQPIVSLESMSISGFEALVRWEHPERGLIAPTEFISLAEEAGLIANIGEWVLRESCRQMREWHSSYNNPLTLSVNLSSKQFTRPKLAHRVKQILLETGFDPCHLNLEITESVVMEDALAAGGILRELRFLGINLSIDDFGTGYSSLSYLHRFPVNTLKIDRSFTASMGKPGECSEIVSTIISLAKHLGMNVVAEGVETEEQLEELCTLKCEYGQGYLFSKPVNAERASVLIQERLLSHLVPTLLLEDRSVDSLESSCVY